MSLTSLTTGISDYATRRAIQQLASKLNYDASPTFAGLTISGEALSSTLITQWSTAYSWGDHAGLYDTIGTASGEIDDHESTYDHSLLHSPVTLDALTGITLTGQQLSYTAGYAIPTTAKQAEWDSAYTHKTTEDAINGLVSCDGSGAYTAKVIGTDVQAYDADLTAIAALTPTDSNIIVGDGSTWVAESGDTARTSLGLGTGNSPTFTALILSGTTKALYAGPWTGAPDVISAHSNIYGDLFCGNVGENVGRYRLTSNANSGYLFWNEYYDNSDERQMDTTKPSYSLAFGGSGDYCSIRRSAAGVNPISWSNLLHIAGSTGIVTAGGKIRSNTAFNLNGTDGVTQAAAAGTVCDVTALAGGIATAQTQITYAADGTYNFDATSGKVSSITITNGRITAITTAA
jgi:hypothetical protein